VSVSAPLVELGERTLPRADAQNGIQDSAAQIGRNQQLSLGALGRSALPCRFSPEKDVVGTRKSGFRALALIPHIRERSEGSGAFLRRVGPLRAVSV
jgi:hypothetical protein